MWAWLILRLCSAKNTLYTFHSDSLIYWSQFQDAGRSDVRQDPLQLRLTTVVSTSWQIKNQQPFFVLFRTYLGSHLERDLPDVGERRIQSALLQLLICQLLWKGLTGKQWRSVSADIAQPKNRDTWSKRITTNFGISSVQSVTIMQMFYTETAVQVRNSSSLLIFFVL